jgi:hypothetical protein
LKDFNDIGVPGIKLYIDMVRNRYVMQSATYGNIRFFTNMMISDAFSSFEIGHFNYIPSILNIFFVCMYSVYILMNRYVEREKAEESYNPSLVYVLLQGKNTQESILYCSYSMYFVRSLSSTFLILFFGSESMFTTKPKVFCRVLGCPLLPWVIFPAE